MGIPAPTFDQAVEAFLFFCRSKGLMPRTLETYAFALSRLRLFLARSSPTPTIPARHELRAFIVEMLERGLSRSSVRVRMRSIRCFANFLEREGLVAESPMRGVDIPRVPRSEPRVLTPEEIRKLLHAAQQTTWTGIRNYAMLLTFLDTGIRLSELISLDMADVDLGAWTIRVRKGKGGKERQVFIGKTLHRALRKWVDVRGATSLDAPFFITRSGRRHDARNVDRIVGRIAGRAGLERVSPHALRRSFATAFVRNNGNLFALQRMLGHSDIKVTQLYVGLDNAAVQDAHAKASPVDRLFRDG